MKSAEETLTQWVNDRIVLDGGKGYALWSRLGIKAIAHGLREADLSLQPAVKGTGSFALRKIMWTQAFDLRSGSVVLLLTQLARKGLSRKINGLWVAKFETWDELVQGLFDLEK